MAHNLGIPLNRRRGPVLTAYPSVAWLCDLSQMKGSFSFHEVRNFLLHPGLPWKDPKSNRQLIAAAIDLGLVEGGLSSWKFLADRIPACKGVFASLMGIVQASGMEDLHTALYRFLRNYLDTNSWSETDAAAWQRSIRIMDELAEQLREFPEMKMDSFTFALDQLGSTLYLPQTHGGVAVYDYRVGGGLEVNHHFCLNFNVEATTINRSGLQFLREDIQRRLFDSHFASTEDFLQAYRKSGRHVHISYSRRTQGVENLPVFLFLEADEVGQADGVGQADEVGQAMRSGRPMRPGRRWQNPAVWTPAGKMLHGMKRR